MAISTIYVSSVQIKPILYFAVLLDRCLMHDEHLFHNSVFSTECLYSN